MSKNKNKAYGWMLTINNPVFKDVELVSAMLQSPETYQIAYFCNGWEHYSVVDIKYRKLTPHYQMLIVFGVYKTFKDVKALFPRAHIEALWATVDRASSYCKKDGVFKEAGSMDWAEFLLGESKLGGELKDSDGGKGVVLPPPPSLIPSFSSVPGTVVIDGDEYQVVILPSPSPSTNLDGDPMLYGDLFNWSISDEYPKYWD